MTLWRTMGSLFLSDEELVKKDDDHKPTKASQWSPARAPPRKLLKRVALALAAGFLIYLFIHNVPTDVPIVDHRRPSYASKHASPGHGSEPPRSIPRPRPVTAPNWSKPSSDKKKDPKKDKDLKKDKAPSQSESGYDGPIRFENLAVSLHAISGTMGDYNENKNILFVASSLQSAALLLPMACQMGGELRSYVHFALMSRSVISMEELAEVNGVDEACHIIFHDARPDHAASSTDERFQRSVMRGMYHIHLYMHPQAVVVDAGDESALFIEAMRSQVNSMGAPLIEIPEDKSTQLSYLTKLDSSSLAVWHKVNIEILIQAAPGTSGNLIRLLKSLAAADFSASAVPHLTIELPSIVDPATAKFLETYEWPPASAYNPSRAKQLTLRHRIPLRDVTEEESSVRFLESFWPANSHYSHVLVLSPQVELSPSFYHYIKYSVLEYIYSRGAVAQQYDSRLMGISLDLPSTHLDGSKPFSPPSGKGDDAPTSFLWQTPSSNAVLFTGKKWVELHAFVTRLLEWQHARPQARAGLPSLFSDKLVSKRYPSWLEHALKLSRARGYWTLYPSRSTAETLAEVHQELYRPPEEYQNDVGYRGRMPDGGFLMAGSFMDSLPSRGNLLAFDDMPLLLWDGKPTALEKLDSYAAEYTAEIRRAVGGCEALSTADLLPRRSARDLFCVREE